MSASGSVSFDRAAEYYDATRNMTPEAEAAVADLLSRELADAERCLEIGIGTGRIALPLARAGVSMTGLDLSAAMLRRLAEKSAGAGLRIPVVRGDATALPFVRAAFDAVAIAHVLHLIPDWRGALGEVKRVVRPGGVLLVTLGTEAGIRDEIETRFVASAGLRRPFVGLDHDPEQLEVALREIGATVRVLPAVRQVKWTSLEEFISRLERGLYSFTWPIPDADRRTAADAVRGWARERFGALNVPRRFESLLVWRACRMP